MSLVIMDKTLYFFFDIIRIYLKNKISVQGKARNGEKAEHTRSM
jgi:hypothetical protein